MCQHVMTIHLFGTSHSQPPTGWPSSFRCHFPCSRSSKLLPCLGRLKAGILEPGNPGSCPVLLDGSSSVHGCASTSSGVSMLRSPHPSQHCDGWAPINDGGSTAEIWGSKGMFFFGKRGGGLLDPPLDHFFEPYGCVKPSRLLVRSRVNSHCSSSKHGPPKSKPVTKWG